MKELDKKLNKHFGGKVVRKDLTKQVKGNAVVPTYVLEYLLGQYCATDDEDTINDGVKAVLDIIAKHYVHRNQSEQVKYEFTRKNGESHRIIDKISAHLVEKDGTYLATFSNLDIKEPVLIEKEVIEEHRKILTSGVWSIIDLSYFVTSEVKGKESPWLIERVKPIQISHVDMDEYKDLRREFTKDEWVDIIMQSLGLEPEHFNFRSKLLQLTRMVSFCENNYNLIELGPKGTGKSHIYSEMSPHGMLISGGEVTQAKLFVNNTSKQVGLVGYWDNIAFDEFAGIKKRVDKNLVDTMKNYMAQKTFSRGSDPQSATASFSFVGNTMHSVSYMMKHTHLFEALPETYKDSAFLDRIHCYLPGWEVEKLRKESFADGYGFIVDYLAEILKRLRNEDYSFLCTKYFELSDEITTRDSTGIMKTFSGLCKIIYPHGECTKEEAKEILDFAVECRRRVQSQLVKMDETFNELEFSYTSKDNYEKTTVLTLEEKQFPSLSRAFTMDESTKEKQAILQQNEKLEKPAKQELLSGKHIVFHENEKGISYKRLFAPYLKNATEIVVQDPYIRLFYQVKNMMEFIQMVLLNKAEGDDVNIKLITQFDEEHEEENKERLEQLKNSLDSSGIIFEYEFDQSMGFHARSIVTDTGWKISIDRGLDIFQAYDFKNPFNLANTLQEERLSRGFEVTYLEVDSKKKAQSAKDIVLKSIKDSMI